MQKPISIETMRSEMESAIRDFRATGNGVMDIRQRMRHPDITELLHEFAYRKDKKPASITIMYTGQPAAAPIRLCCLRPRVSFETDKSLRPLRVGLISMRHLPLDHIVDMAWFLNKNLNENFLSNETHLQRDNYCYMYTKDYLPKLAATGTRHIHLYQTGYQIAVVGFYRALIEYLLDQQTKGPNVPSLIVTPYYYEERYSMYWKGNSWS